MSNFKFIGILINSELLYIPGMTDEIFEEVFSSISTMDILSILTTSSLSPIYNGLLGFFKCDLILSKEYSPFLSSEVM